MVIFNGDVGRSCVAPSEHDAPLLVDPNGMVTATITLERFQAVTRWNGEIGQFAGVVELDEFSKSDPTNGSESTVTLLVEKLFGVSICKRLDHLGGRLWAQRNPDVSVGVGSPRALTGRPRTLRRASSLQSSRRVSLPLYRSSSSRRLRSGWRRSLPARLRYVSHLRRQSSGRRPGLP